MTDLRGWKFPQRDFNDVEQEVTEADQFDTETVPAPESLVREAIQNSQDARLQNNGDPVRLKFRYHTVQTGLDIAFLQELLDGLKPHIQEAGFEINQERLENPAVFVVEDFGTEGLTGSVDNDADQGNFRSFWFRHGGSFKHGSQNGRWGLGKLTFPMSSALRCFFGLTLRPGESDPLVLGQAVLRTHRMNGSKYAPHGHYGDFVQGRLSPVSDPAFTARFSRGLGLTRATETGLSVVVPYPVEEPDLEILLRFVARNYAYPILTGRLVVDVLGEKIDAQTLRTIGGSLLDPGLLDFIEALHVAGDGLVEVADVPYDNGYRLEEKHVGEDTLRELRARYANGELIGFKVPVLLSRKKESRKRPAKFSVFLRAASEGQPGGAVYVRGDITVPDAASGFSGKGAFAALLAHDPVVSEFLADAENPAHTKWVGTASRLKENWKYPLQALQFIRSAPNKLFQMLTTGREIEDPKALLNFFWIDEPDAPRPKDGDDESRRKTKTPPPPPPPSKKRLVIRKLKGGFEIAPGPDFGELRLPARLKVDVAYDIEYGNAFKEWQPYDFDLSENDSVNIEISGADYESEGQTIRLEITDPDFDVRVQGFDPKRDIVVQANWLKGGSANA